MAAPISTKRRFRRKLPRLVKAGRQWMRVVANGGRPQTRLVFVVGSQRSGTRLPLQVLDHAPEVSTYSEGTAPYFRSVLLEPLDRIEALVRRSPSPIVALKPICETHRLNELLDRFPRSRAIWIFRHYQGAVNSASVKWKSGQEAVRRLAARDLKTAGWRAGGLSEEALDLTRRLYRQDMSLHEANAVLWYLRNSLFFESGADERPDVLLVRYEDLVGNPSQAFRRVFDFIGIDAPVGFAESVMKPSVRARAFPEISGEIRHLCEDLHAKLLSHYQERVELGEAGVAMRSNHGS